MPLALLPIQLISSSGSPVSGATITLTSTSCGSGTDTYNLPVTDGKGDHDFSALWLLHLHSHGQPRCDGTYHHHPSGIANTFSVTTGASSATYFAPQSVELAA